MVEKKMEYSLLSFGASYQETYERSIGLISRGIVSGLIFILFDIDVEPFKKEMLPTLESLNIPFVVIHSLARELDYNNVGMDSYGGAYLATKHLIDQGYTEIGFSFKALNFPQCEELHSGFCQALSDNRLKYHEQYVIDNRHFKPGGNWYQDVRSAVKKLPQLPRAFVTINDQATLGTLQALKDMGKSVPRDVAVVSFREEQQDQFLEDDITTVYHPIAEKGKKAVSILEGLMTGQLNRNEIQRELVKPYLVVRKTCGAE
jgi:DNA-binding LacI/PurR family transcriptional regulator